MTTPIRVGIAVERERRYQRCAEVVAAEPGMTVVTEGANPALGAVLEADPACLVTDEPGRVPADAPPVVAIGASPSTADSATAYAVSEDDLSAQIRFATRQTGADSTDRIRRLHEATADIVAARTTDDLYRRTVEVAESVLGFDVCYLLVRDGDQFVPVTASTTPTDTGLQPVPLDYGLTGRTYERGEPTLVGDIEDHPLADPAHGEYASGLSVPAGDWGVFQVTAKTRDAFDETDVELVELLLTYVGETRQRIRTASRLRDRRETIERLHEATADIVAADSVQAVYDLTVEAAESVLDLDVTTLAIAETDAGEPAFDTPADHLAVRATSAPERAPPVGSTLSIETGVLGQTYRGGESIVVDDVRDREDADPTETTFRSALSIPVGEIGVLQTIADEPDAYDESDRRFAELLASHAAGTLERVHAEASLREKHDRLSALFENVSDPVVDVRMVEERPIVQAVNEPFESVFGYESEAVVGRRLDDVVVPDEAGAGDLNERALAGERFQTAVQRETADGIRDFLLRVAPVSVGEDDTEGYAIYTDITEQKRRQRELERQNDRLDEFTRMVSHDLRNPLQVARGRLELARETGEAEHFDRSMAAHDHMQRLIDDLLSLARRGDIVDDTEPVALGEVACEAWTRIDHDSATLSVEDDLTIAADPERLSELLENLFANAVEHGSTAAADPLTVGVGAVTEGDEAVGFYVEDDGAGISEAERERIMESGYTTAEDGTGFGLTIVQQFAQAHGWSVSVSERAGARFTFVGVETV